MLLSGLLAVALSLTGCGGQGHLSPDIRAGTAAAEAPFTTETPIAEVMSDPAFGDYGRLLFPVQSHYYSGDTLGELRLTYYTHIDPDTTVAIANNLKTRALAGDGRRHFVLGKADWQITPSASPEMPVLAGSQPNRAVRLKRKCPPFSAVQK